MDSRFNPGGSSKQRRRWRKELERVFLQSRGLPWYEGTMLWGAGGSAIAIVLTVIAAMKHDLRWLLILAWPFGTLALFAICRAVLNRKALVITFTCFLSLACALALYKLDHWLAIPVDAGTSGVTSPPSMVTSKERAESSPPQQGLIDGSEIKRRGEAARVHIAGIDPSLDVLVETADRPAFNFFNHGSANIYLWGDKLDDGPKSLDEPRTITPGGSYHIWADKVIEEIRSKIGTQGELKVNFHVYVTTEDGRKHILKYLLWATMTNGNFRIEMQNLGTIDADFTLPENS